MSKNKNIKLFGLHIPKCAGTTLINTAYDALSPVKFYCNSQPYPFHRMRYPEFITLDFKQLQLVFGHNVHEEMLKFLAPYPVFLFTGLRSPFERVASECYFFQKFSNKFDKSIRGDLEDYVSKNRNKMCNYLINSFPTFIDSSAKSLADKAISVLNEFDLVYDTKDFDRDLSSIYEFLELSIPDKRSNVTGANQHFKLPKDHILEENHEDSRLYEYFLENSSRFSKKNLDEIMDAVSNKSKKRNDFMNQAVDYEKLCSFVYGRKANVYSFSKVIDEVFSDKLDQLQSLAYEIKSYSKRYKGNLEENTRLRETLEETQKIIRSVRISKK